MADQDKIIILVFDISCLSSAGTLTLVDKDLMIIIARFRSIEVKASVDSSLLWQLLPALP